MEILLVGGGNMGAALAVGWKKAGFPMRHLTILEKDPARGAKLKKTLGCKVMQTAPASAPDVLLLAVKPQQLPQVAQNLAPILSSKTLVISIAAGIKLATLVGFFKPKTPVIRAMPNLPATIQQGVTALVANRSVQPKHRALASKLFEASGAILRLSSEQKMDAVTATSGSGPAYLYAFAEAMIAAAMKLGLSATEAAFLVTHTLAGSANLALKSGHSVDQLRANVTSKGGTTEAALKFFAGAKGIKPLVEKSMQAASRRSRELAD